MLQDTYNGKYNDIRIGDTVKIEYGLGHSVSGKVRPRYMGAN